MAADVVMPALGMAQETGVLIRWLKREGERVEKGEPIMEVETDKATVEVEAPDSGWLSRVSAREGEEIPVGQVIAVILAEGEALEEQAPGEPETPKADGNVEASPLARKIAEERGVDLSAVRAPGGKVRKEDVLAYLERKPAAPGSAQTSGQAAPSAEHRSGRRVAASPKARRLAVEQGIDLETLRGSGPDGAILAADVPAGPVEPAEAGFGQAQPVEAAEGGAWQAEPAELEESGAGQAEPVQSTFMPEAAGAGQGQTTTGAPKPLRGPGAPAERSGGGGYREAAAVRREPEPAEMPQAAEDGETESLSRTWQVMAERMSASWQTAPHFYLVREARASGLVEMHERVTPAIQRAGGVKPTYTDLLVKLAAAALRGHPRLNASWAEEGIRNHGEINIGLAVGIDDGLVVPVIRKADRLGVGEIAARREDLVTRAGERRLRPEDLAGATFTITNLGMYNVDAFLAVLNPPQAAILAVGRIADRVVPENGQPVVRPTVVLTLSVDHRVADGLRAAQFLDELVGLIEEPYGLMA